MTPYRTPSPPPPPTPRPPPPRGYVRRGRSARDWACAGVFAVTAFICLLVVTAIVPAAWLGGALLGVYGFARLCRR